MATEYGSRLKTARNHAGLTQVALSKKTGIPQSTISTAEREGNGSGETPVYAQACGVDALWLATGQGEMLPTAITITATLPGLTMRSAIENQPLAPVQQAQEAINGVASLNVALNSLTTYLAQVEPGRRESVATLMASLVRTPDDDGLRAALTALLTPSGFAETQRKAA